MKILQKAPERDFIILNLTDPQLNDDEWNPEHRNRKILEYTITELIYRVRPDLITVSGDLAWAGCDYSYDMFAEFLNGFGIPWAPVWGNHDNQNGAEYINGVAERYMKYSHCLYEKGDPTLGNGNYIISVEEDGKPIEAIFMLDSHDKDLYCDENGNPVQVWSKLTQAQGEWISAQSAELRARGCADGTIVCHIPIYGYRKASAAAYKSTVLHEKLTPDTAVGDECWNERYADSVGVQHEDVSSYPEDDGMLETIRATDLVHQIVVGHNHVNNWIIRYDGICMAYALKCGAGSYWEQNLNGGTVFRIDSTGVSSVYHEYVDVDMVIND